jgi:hypothetical protein
LLIEDTNNRPQDANIAIDGLNVDLGQRYHSSKCDDIGLVQELQISWEKGHHIVTIPFVAVEKGFSGRGETIGDIRSASD